MTPVIGSSGSSIGYQPIYPNELTPSQNRELSNMIKAIQILTLIRDLLEKYGNYGQPFTIIIMPQGVLIEPKQNTSPLFTPPIPPPNQDQQNAMQILNQLPKDQRSSVIGCNVISADGRGGVLGWYQPSDPGYINLDKHDMRADSSGEQTASTIAHESFHAFTVQKLLPAWRENKNSPYGQKMEALYQHYVKAIKSGDPSQFPSAYAASKLNEARCGREGFEVGFMEYLAELAANIETGQKAPYPSPELRSAYATMERLLQQANGGEKVAIVQPVRQNYAFADARAYQTHLGVGPQFA